MEAMLLHAKLKELKRELRKEEFMRIRGAFQLKKNHRLKYPTEEICARWCPEGLPRQSLRASGQSSRPSPPVPLRRSSCARPAASSAPVRPSTATRTAAAVCTSPRAASSAYGCSL